MSSRLVDGGMLDSLLTLAEAAEFARLEVPVLRNWIKRGYRGKDKRWTHLPAVWTADGIWLVRPLDVAKAEAATRKRARRDALRG